MPLVGCGQCSLCAGGDYIHCENTEKLQSYYRGGEGRATYAQYLLKPAWLLPKIPDSVSYELAALACCGLGPSFGAMQRMQVNAFDTILITGAGPVGLGAVINARFRGACVIVVESIPYRIERARELGANEVLEPNDEGILQTLQELTGGRGVDCALDCSGNVQAQRLCVDATRRRGRVGFIGECYEDLVLQISPDMIRKGLTLFGSWHYRLEDYLRVMQVIQESSLADRLISHVLPMSRIQKAFELSASHQTAKVILRPWE
jgi:threonine dehydrogenase-like Zn-dependent dehydrogenase